jgi:hypothetical protein
VRRAEGGLPPAFRPRNHSPLVSCEAPPVYSRAVKLLAANTRLLLCGAAALWTAGCGALLGVGDYAVAEEEPDAEPRTVELPLLPALPDPDVIDDCRVCAARECAAEREACLASERCAARLRCHGECSDPNCAFRCVDTEPESATFEEYYACVFGPFGGLNTFLPGPKCLADCNVGANWQCARKLCLGR